MKSTYRRKRLYITSMPSTAQPSSKDLARKGVVMLYSKCAALYLTKEAFPATRYSMEPYHLGRSRNGMLPETAVTIIYSKSYGILTTTQYKVVVVLYLQLFLAASVYSTVVKAGGDSVVCHLHDRRK